MSIKRGSSLTMNQAKPIPNNDMIFSFLTTSTSFAPGYSVYPLAEAPNGTTSPGSIAAGTALVMPRAGTFSTLIVRGDINASVTDEVFTFEKNGASTPIVATATVGTDTGIDNIHSIAVVQGDIISIARGANATPSFNLIAGSIYFTPA